MKASIFPGQGAQKPSMGRELFGKFPEKIKVANSILGYDLVKLIEKNPDGRLKDTRYTQPALFVVNALHYLSKSEGGKSDFLAGHSLGEYNALWAAGSLDFKTGLRLVKARGEAMSHAPKGSMAAVIGLDADKILEVLGRSGLASVDIANINTGHQIVLSFPSEVLEDLERSVLESGAKGFIPLDVGGAFHSRYMENASQEFLSVLKTCEFKEPSIPVISNVTARPYGAGEIPELLGRQITSGVQWLGTVEYLLAQGVKDFVECGPGDILSRMILSIREVSRKKPSRISIPSSNIEAEMAEGFVAVPLLSALHETGYFQKMSLAKEMPRFNLFALEWLADSLLIRRKPKGRWELFLEDLGFEEMALIMEVSRSFSPATSKRVPPETLQSLKAWMEGRGKSSKRLYWALSPILLPLLLRNSVSLLQISRQELELLKVLDWVNLDEEEVAWNSKGRKYLEAVKSCADIIAFEGALGRLGDLLSGKFIGKNPLLDRKFKIAPLQLELAWLKGNFEFHQCLKNVLMKALEVPNGKVLLPKWIVLLNINGLEFLESFLQELKAYLPNQSARPSILLCATDESDSLPETDELFGFPLHTSRISVHSPEKILNELRKKGVQDTQSILYLHMLPDPIVGALSKTEISNKATKTKWTPALFDLEGREVSQARLECGWTQFFESWKCVLEKNPFGIIQVSINQPVEGGDQAFRLKELLYAMSGRCFPTAHGLGQLAAKKGLLLEAAEVLGSDRIAGSKVSLFRFRNRGYGIRYAAEADLPELLSLENACWKKGDRCDEAALRRRLSIYPEGQFVLEMDGKVVAVLFTQRIRNQDELNAIPYDRIHEVHDPLGRIIQCVAINVLPAYQERRIGDQLLEYALCINGLDPWITSAVAITKCKDFHRDSEGSVERYIQKRSADGRLVDPILRFHELHGAEVVQAIPGYRPLDKENKGYGVLVRYDLAKRKRQEIEFTNVNPARGEEALSSWLTTQVKDMLGKNESSVFDMERPLMEMGLDSSSLLDLSERLSLRLGRKLEPDFFYRYSNVKSIIIGALSENRMISVSRPAKQKVREAAGGSSANEVAIIGISCRLPGGIDSPDALWDFLLSGKSAIGTEPNDRWSWPEGSEPESKPGITLGGFLEDIKGFDAPFFRISPLEADMMDPRQRLLLELSWKALEDGAIEPGTLSGTKTGVFVGASGSDYLLLMEQKKTPMIPSIGTGTSMSILANRLSYFYGLTAPSLLVDTACSSSLVAVHEAIQSLRNGSSHQAIVAGINLICHPGTTLAYYDAGMLSPDGRCKTFDASANGYVRSEGAIVIVLKPLSAALKDGNPIHAIIKGSSCNHGGASGGLTVPNPSQQADLVREAWADGKLTANRFGLIESHGTGTPMGDPIEIQGLKEAYAASMNPNGTIAPCVLGAVKTNLGHLEAAAGLAGLLKVVLCLKNMTIPGNVGFRNLNPAIKLDGTPIEIRGTHCEWKASEGLPRVAGVSSFGSGGTNAHVALEEYTSLDEHSSESAMPRVFVLSARTENSLKEYARSFHRYLGSRAGSGIDLDSLAYTMSRRKQMEHRFSMVFKTKKELAEGLRHFAEGMPGKYFTGHLEADWEHSRLPVIQDNEADCIEIGRKFCQGHAQWEADDPIGRVSGPGDRLPMLLSGLPTYPFDKSPHWFEHPLRVESALLPTPLLHSGWKGERRKVSLAHPSEMFRFASNSGGVRAKIHLHRPGAARDGWVLASEMKPGIPVLSLAENAKNAGIMGILNELESLIDSFVGRKGIKAIVLDLNLGNAWDDKEERKRFWDSRVPVKIAKLPVPTVARLRDSTGCMGLALGALCDLFVGSDTPRANLRKYEGDFIPYESAIIRERFGNIFGELLVPACTEPGEECDLDQLLESIGSQTELANTLLKTHLGRNMVSRLSNPFDFAPISQGIEVDPLESIHSGSEVSEQIALGHDSVSLEIRENGVAIVRMKEIEGKNTFTDAFVDGVKEAFSRISMNETIKAIVLIGYDAYFCAGATKKLLLDIQSRTTKFTDIGIYSIALECAVPVVAAMQGHAIGAGWSMGMYCDFQVYSKESIYCSPYMGYGFTPGAGATLVFPSKLGSGLANEILMLAREYKGFELARRGAVKYCYPRAEVFDRAIAIADALALESRDMLIRKKREAFGRLTESLKAYYQAELLMHDKSFVGNADVKKRIENQFGEGMESNENEPTPSAPAPVAGTNKIKQFLRKSLSDELRMEAASISDSRSFSEMGLDSVTGVTWLRKINKEYKLQIPATMVYTHPNLSAFSDYVKGMLPDSRTENTGATEVALRQETVSAPANKVVRVKQEYGQKKIAVIGMAGQYPMAEDLGAFWRNIQEGRDCIDKVPDWRWKTDLFFETDRHAPGKTYSKWIGLLDSAAEFDPAFFNLSPRQAINMDPQQRVFLRNAWHCLEDAGVVPKDLAKKSCGVYVGCSVNDYHRPFPRENLDSHQFTGEHAAILAARIAYFLDLRGPCLSIDTACSSSLVAIASACDSLILGNCDIALAGGVCVLPGPDMHISTSKAGMLSPTGKCRPFDAGADGFVPGEGVGVVLLKRLDDALRDGDRIQAVLSGWGVNQDGRSNGITAPNGDSQRSLIKDVHRRFGIDPASIGLIEAHGTGTQLGDPIEADGLLSAFGSISGKCALGSLKSNFGHLLAASGVAGLTKVILSLAHKKITPTINFERLNPLIDLSGSPFYISECTQEWTHSEREPRRGAVSSFGFSGTNCHLIVEEFPGELAHKGNTGKAIPKQIFPISANSRDSLTQYAKKHRRRIEEILKGHNVVAFNDYAFTLQTGRQEMTERLAITARSYEQLLTRLDDYLNGDTQGEGIYRGTVILKFANVEHLGMDRDFLSLQKSWAASGRIDYLADFWARGVDLAWKSVFSYAGMKLVSLPMYPFSQERYWKDRNVLEAEVSSLRPRAENSQREAESQAAPEAKLLQISHKAIGTAKDGVREGGASDRETKEPARNGVDSNMADPETKVKEVLSDLLFMEANEIPTASSFIDIGLDSIVAVEFVKRLNQELALSLDVGVTLNYPSVDKLVGHLAEIMHGEYQDPGGWEGYSKTKSEIHSSPDTQAADFEMRMKGLGAKNFQRKAESQSAPEAKPLQISAKTIGTAKDGVRAGGASDRGTKEPAWIGVHSNMANPETKVKEVLSDLLFMETSEIPTARSFIDIGLDSIVAVEFVKRLNQELSLSLDVGVTLNYPSVDKLVGHLAKTMLSESPDPGGWEEYSKTESGIHSQYARSQFRNAHEGARSGALPTRSRVASGAGGGAVANIA